MSRNSGVPIIARAHRHTERTAVVDPQGSISYDNLLNASSDVATAFVPPENLEVSKQMWLILVHR